MDPNNEAEKTLKSMRKDIATNKRRLEEATRIMQCFSSILNRYSKTANPVLRYTLLMDKFLIACEVAMTLMKSGLSFGDSLIEDHGQNITSLEEFKTLLAKEEQVKKINIVAVDLFKAELDRLMDWIQQPQMAPDQPVGNALLKTTQTAYIERLKSSTIVPESTITLNPVLTISPSSTCGWTTQIIDGREVTTCLNSTPS